MRSGAVWLFAVCLVTACGPKRGRPDLSQLALYLEDTSCFLRYDFNVDSSTQTVTLFAIAENPSAHWSVPNPGYTYLDGGLVPLQNNSAILPQKARELAGTHDMRVLFSSDESFDWATQRPLSPQTDSVRTTFDIVFFGVRETRIQGDSLVILLDKPMPGFKAWLEILPIGKDRLPTMRRPLVEMNLPITSGRIATSLDSIPFRLRGSLFLRLSCRHEQAVFYKGRQKGLFTYVAGTDIRYNFPERRLWRRLLSKTICT
ncbi:MAG: hypothetical protein JWP27_80 [Flaviaesturariibacter sp.]|nr:hypothetical protein [Flaviaesturariibacter sp.]